MNHEASASSQRSSLEVGVERLKGSESRKDNLVMLAASSTPVIVAMLKAPRAGFVKTRLASEIGTEAAVAIYRRLVEHQMSAIPRGWRVEVHFAPADGAAEMQQWLGLDRAFYPQVGDDLGERLVHATAGAFGRGAGTLVVIGGDCPGLDETCLREACCALESAEVVLGPAVDGGYYLIGLRRPVPELFQGIPWSSDAVLKKTLERVREARLSIAMLPTKEDVDDLASWRRAHGALPPVAVEALRHA